MPSDWLHLSWKSLVARGALAVIFGLIAIFWSPETAIALALLWGIWVLVDGFGLFFQAFESDTPTAARILFILLGILAVIAGLIAIFSPGLTAVTLTWVLGIFLIVRGIFDIIGAFAASKGMPRGLLFLLGVLDIVLGILFVSNPGVGAVSVATVLGILALFWGIVLLVTGFGVRKDVQTA